jgi:hypothetical protein
MTTIVNLNKFRKQRERAASERRAAENLVRFGRGEPGAAPNGIELHPLMGLAPCDGCRCTACA